MRRNRDEDRPGLAARHRRADDLAVTSLRSSFAVTIIAVTIGIAADLVVDAPPGAGIAMVGAAVGVALLVLARPSKPGVGFAILGMAFAAMPLVRTSGPLVALDLAAAVGCFAWAAGFARSARLGGTARDFVARGTSVIASTPDGMQLIAAPASAAVRGLEPSHVRAVPRMVLLVVPVVAVMGALLASADAVFARVVTAPLDAVWLGRAPRHVAVTGAVAVAFATLVSRARTSSGPHDGPLRRRLAPAEWVLVLASLDALFLLFIGVRLATLFGGRTHLLEEAGLTASEYARSGFFQLLAVAALTSGLLVAVTSWGARSTARHRRAFAVLAAAMLGLTLAMLASSLLRLGLYEEAFGLTWLRLAVHVTILTLAAALLCGLAAVLAAPHARWLPTAVVAIGIVALGTLNALDPDAFIARANLARAERGHALDVAVLGGLSPDAAPAILDALPGLPPRERATLALVLACRRDELIALESEAGWASLSLSRRAAVQDLRAAGLGACP